MKEIRTISVFKWLTRIVALVAVLAALVGVGGYYWLSSSLPQLEGTVVLAGLDAPVTVSRDSDGVPTIEAQSEKDAYFALGFVHAQDRLWQMESIRRIATGRLSEILGERSLKVDRYMRTMGLQRRAEETLHQLGPEVRAVIESYGAGINAWLAGRRGALPPELVALRYEPEPWKATDSLLWGQLMALRLAGNRGDEIIRAGMEAILPPERVAELWPSDGEARTAAYVPPPAVQRQLAGLLDGFPSSLEETTASNIWAVSPARSKSGGALLANDPHLDLDAPILWYLVRLKAPGLDLNGVTTPGVPFHLLGHNGRIAWGMTTTTSDTQDLFIEKLVGENSYAAPDGPRPFETRAEIIRIKDSPPETITVRTTRHGPVISDVNSAAEALAKEGYVVALSAAFLAPGNLTPLAMYKLNRASDWASFTDALRSFHAPQMNLFYADTQGNIGRFSPGRVPMRAQGDGSAPVPGWDGVHDWMGWIPFEGLPQAYNPAMGTLHNANNKIALEGYPYHLGSYWPESYRYQRIGSLLDAKALHDTEGMKAIQGDIVSLLYRDMKPLLLSHEPATERGRAAVALLKAWDGSMDRNRPEPLIFNAWLTELKQALFADELGDIYDKWFGTRPRSIRIALTTSPVWCDDTGSEETETCGQMIERSLESALDSIEERHGKTVKDWRWGSEHQAVFPHLLFRHDDFLGPLTELRIETDGGDNTVNRGTFSTRRASLGFTHVHGSGFRGIYDMSKPQESQFMIATGPSGNPLSPYYGNLPEAWRDNRSIQFGGKAAHILTLTPR